MTKDQIIARWKELEEEDDELQDKQREIEARQSSINTEMSQLAQQYREETGKLCDCELLSMPCTHS
jgi:peptidoglycan hydrolase CwlO-like protein